MRAAFVLALLASPLVAADQSGDVALKRLREAEENLSTCQADLVAARSNLKEAEESQIRIETTIVFLRKELARVVTLGSKIDVTTRLRLARRDYAVAARKTIAARAGLNLAERRVKSAAALVERLKKQMDDRDAGASSTA